MAERYYRVGPRFWSDSRSWSEDARHLGLYVLTGPHRKTEGLFRLPKGYIIDDLQWTPERLAQPFEELVSAGFIRYDDATSVMLIVNALKWQAPQNPNMVKGAIRFIEELPETPLLREFCLSAERLCEPLAEALRERFPDAFGESQAPAPAPSPAPTHPPAGAPAGDPAERLCVQKKPVTDYEEELGREIIRVFNDLAGTSLTFEANYEKVVERIRQEPDMSGADHRRVLEANFKRPWWSDTPGIGVIYGSAKQFEQAIDKAAHGEKRAATASKYDQKMEVAQA